VSISNTNFGNVNIYVSAGANNLMLAGDCISSNGSGTDAIQAVNIAAGVTGTTIKNSTIGGANSTNQSVDAGIADGGGNSNATATGDYIYNCVECVQGSWTLNSSYVDASAVTNAGGQDDWYFSDATISANDDVFLNHLNQTSEIFGDTHYGRGGVADNHITVTNSLLGGGGYLIYADSSSNSVGASTMNIANNRFARCIGLPITHQYPGGGGNTCGRGDNAGADAFGYWPGGGYFGVDDHTYCSANSSQVWSNNVWDDDDQAVGC